ncbi:MAG: hypothetical protein IJS60_00600 [Abditibacteriota bacterium]|nr:hypothetical protein [Abditibacteriota bacterium]
MAKKNGPESWQIPSEDEVKDLYGEDEKLEQKVAKANELAGDGTRQKTFEEILEERKSNFYLMGMILLGVIIVAIVVSIAITIIKAGKNIENTESKVENQNIMKSNADSDVDGSLQEGTNNMDPYGYGATPQNYPEVPKGQPVPGVATQVPSLVPEQPSQPVPQGAPQPTPEAYPQPMDQTPYPNPQPQPSAEPQGQAYPATPYGQ